MLLRKLGALVVALGGLFVMSHAANAQSIDDILSKGSINIGMSLELLPYNFKNAENQPDGFEVELANLLGKNLGVTVNIVPTNGPDRISFLLTNKIDLVMGGLSINADRAKQISFSNPYGTIQNGVYAKTGTNITSTADLKGLRVGVPRGSNQEQLLQEQLGDQVQIMSFPYASTCYQALITGQVDAIIVAESAVIQAVEETGENNDIEHKYSFTEYPIGFGMRRGQTDLLQWVNTFLFYVQSTGELQGLTEKWFKRPLGTLGSF
jgi:polar amino acid transport system substrate-binding protein